MFISLSSPAEFLDYKLPRYRNSIVQYRISLAIKLFESPVLLSSRASVLSRDTSLGKYCEGTANALAAVVRVCVIAGWLCAGQQESQSARNISLP